MGPRALVWPLEVGIRTFALLVYPLELGIRTPTLLVWPVELVIRPSQLWCGPLKWGYGLVRFCSGPRS